MEDELNIKVMDKTECQCAKCAYGLLSGWSNWNCLKYKEGKPSEIRFENKDCPFFKKKSSN